MTFNRFMKSAAGVSSACLLALGLVTACSTSDYLKVTSPSRIPASSLEDPSNAQLLVNGAISDFDCAFQSYIVAGGLIGQELQDATQTADRYPYDQRTIISSSGRYQTGSCTAIGVYSPLQTARVSADNARRLLSGWTDAQVANRQQLLATAAAYEAYSQLLLAESACTGVSAGGGVVFSSFDNTGTIVYGTPVEPAAAYDSAITHFTEAITAATAAGAGANSVLYMAYDGRARAKLDKGDYAGAKADAALVPSGFVYNSTSSTVSSRRQNKVWSDNGQVSQGVWNTASSVEAYYRNMNDPRVPVVDTKTSSVTKVPIFVQTKYTSGNSSVPIASYKEAQLIIAEADVRAGGAALVEATTIINASKANGNETPVAVATLDDVIEERRRALFLESQHLHDLIRFNIPLNPPAGAAFPGGGSYGSQLCLPLPDVERFNNPNLK